VRSPPITCSAAPQQGHFLALDVDDDLAAWQLCGQYTAIAVGDCYTRRLCDGTAASLASCERVYGPHNIFDSYRNVGDTDLKMIIESGIQRAICRNVPLPNACGSWALSRSRKKVWGEAYWSS
jgi:hypothetical protein